MISDKLEKLAAREKVWLVVGAIFVFALAVEKLVVQSVVEKCRGWDVAIKTLEVRVASNRKDLQSRDQVTQEYDAVRDLLGGAASTNEAIAEMTGEVNDLAKRTGISIQSMEHKEPVKADGMEEYSVVIGSFEADFKNLLAFLYELQKAPGMLRVNKLNVSPGKTEGATRGAIPVKGAMSITKVMLPTGG
jgi:hypothetical protein